MRQALIGPASELWHLDPERARILLASWISGRTEVVELRNLLEQQVQGRQEGAFEQPSLTDVCLVRHVPLHEIEPPLAQDEIYVGNGVAGSEYFVASQWCNPLKDLNLTDHFNKSVTFSEYLESRADATVWLRPLIGKVLVCTCNSGDCHAGLLASAVNELTESTRAQQTSEYQMGDSECSKVFEDDSMADGFDEEEWDTPKDVQASTLWAANETVSKTPGPVSTKPSWPSSWHWLLQKIRMAQTMIFWEIFAGCAELTKQFAAEGWETGPPVDFLWDETWDVFNPEFLCMLLGILYERRVKLLHLGTPCSSFSMAFNRFVSHAIRSAKFPGGLPDLNAKKRQMVEVGNLLVHVGVALLKAQESMSLLWTWEQPASSLQLLYQPLAEAFQSYAACWVISHVCAYGAPWLKPTAVISNSLLIEGLCLRCPGCESHIRIEGKAPCGNNWSKIASAYWPEWAKAFARFFRPVMGLQRNETTSRQAGWLAHSSVSVKEAVRATDYCPSGGRSLDSVAIRVAALTQPTGRALQQMIPDGLSEETHLKLALSSCHPYQRPLSLEKHMEFAFSCQTSPKQLNRERYSVLGLVEALAEALKDEEEYFRSRLHPELLYVVGKRNVCLARELQYVCWTDDFTCVSDYVIGKPILGWARRAYGQKRKTTVPERELSELISNADENNPRMIRRAQGSDDPSLNEAVDMKVKEEIDLEALAGPYERVDDAVTDSSCAVLIVPRHGIWEQHGGQDETCRLIDDMLISEHNDTAGSEFTHLPADVDKMAAMSRRAQEQFPTEGLSGFASDYRKAYKQDSLSPTQMCLALIAVWSAALSRTLFYKPRTQLFGSRLSPVNFARLPIWTYKVMTVLFLVAMSSCVDDVLCVERTATITSAYRCWRRLCELLGWDVPDSKSPPPSRALRVLGVWLDFTATPRGAFVIMITEDRLEKLLKFLDEIIESGLLSGSMAATLFGQLSWTCTTSHGRAGRANLRPINRRSFERRQGLNPQLRSALTWWRRFLVDYKPRAFRVDVRAARHVISYSDGEGSQRGGVGAALWFADGEPPVPGFLQVPHEVRLLWRQQRSHEFRDIYELEAVAPLLILAQWGEQLMQHCVWTHYVDNDGALSSLIAGSSSVHSGDIICGETWRLIDAYDVAPWFERVASKSNPLDGLSRGRRAGPWHSIEDFVIPKEVINSLRQSTES